VCTVTLKGRGRILFRKNWSSQSKKRRLHCSKMLRFKKHDKGEWPYTLNSPAAWL
jgi:hypothetical protein